MRHLIDQIIVAVQGESERVDVTIHWAGGFESQHEQIRPVAKYDQLADYDRLVKRILELRTKGHTSASGGSLKFSIKRVFGRRSDGAHTTQQWFGSFFRAIFLAKQMRAHLMTPFRSIKTSGFWPT
ncbi:MAG: hypothetical protein ACYC4U_14085 [Pirellulaceae bacterium]